MPDTMIERAVHALEAELSRQHQDGHLGHFVKRDAASDWIAVDGNIDLTPLVRAILTAMREPTDDMVDAAYDGADVADGGGKEFYPRKVWENMIDAALAEGV